jgi:prepilin-type N-terminal cleavage/methylation domain-containing protein/prepilin-type processing-associated H-X9-DG protein
MKLGKRGSGGWTLVEMLVVLAIVALLVALVIPGLRTARQRAKLVACQVNMRQVGEGLIGYGVENSGVFPRNISDWRDATFQTNKLIGPPGHAFGWIGRLGKFLYPSDGQPSLLKLRCPAAAIVDDALANELGFNPTSENTQGSCWLLNSYCSARDASSIPAPAEGVLALEFGVYDLASWDTGALEAPYDPWQYPHPVVRLKRDTSGAAWGWLRSGEERQRNILWCDGHVTSHGARTWPGGDLPSDRDRIRHMRFGLAATNPWDG